ncbi:M28 family peptidase [Steroidobacter sp. S1-65]|uniref:M28 family peptidase n=1 Tax=Steroidobacter gossypii TaxID=2805490 RepID=A0ABS1WRM1_9GAMM|nr:M28 family metallopeptidase [Steroidobacter gossypii]MBM0103623.1 M28 family peptidase [Steroidobacter gossypii]
MLRRSISLLLLMSAAAVPAAERGAWNEVKPEIIRSHVEFLAADLLEGRATASRGHDIAAAYVAAQFRQAGLQPAGDDNSYLQKVPLLEATPVLPGSSAELVRDDDTRNFEYGIHYLPNADFTSASSTLSAPLVFVGFGIDAPELEHNDFENIDVKGRIAVIFSGAPARFSNEKRAYYSWEERKLSTLVDKGAVGVITIDSSADIKRTPWERRVAMSWIPQMRWLDAGGAPQNAFPALKLRFRFNHDAATQLFETAQSNFAAALAASDEGTPQGFELPGMLTLSATTGLRKTESANVVGMLPGSDPQLKNEYVVVTAHLDHLGRGTAVNGDSVYNGAHDNAVGMGIMLELARALHASNAKPRRSVLFVAVTAEEKGLLGSDFFAHQAEVQEKKLVANINMDMPLTFEPVQDFVALGAPHSSLGAVAKQAAAAEGYRLSADAAPELVRFIRSDQFSFIRRGIPALVLGAGYQPRNPSVDLDELRREFLSAHYHQPSDDLTLPIHYPTAADLARINLRIVLAAANSSSAPRWTHGDFFAEKFAADR